MSENDGAPDAPNQATTGSDESVTMTQSELAAMARKIRDSEFARARKHFQSQPQPQSPPHPKAQLVDRILRQLDSDDERQAMAIARFENGVASVSGNGPGKRGRAPTTSGNPMEAFMAMFAQREMAKWQAEDAAREAEAARVAKETANPSAEIQAMRDQLKASGKTDAEINQATWNRLKTIKVVTPGKK